MELKTITKYSLIYTLLTTFLSKLVYLLFNYQNYSEIGFLKLFFSPFVVGIIFIIILVLAFNEIKRKNENSFTKILLVSISIIVTTYILKYFTDWIFYYLNNTIHTKTGSNNQGLLSLSNSFDKIFNRPTFSLVLDLFISTYELIVISLKSLDIKGFLMTLFNSKVILTAMVIFYFSLYFLFQKSNEKGIDAIIPIKNNLTLLKITNKPLWWIMPIYIPFIRLIPKYFINLSIAEKFNKKELFAIGMTILPWFFYGKITLDKSTVANNV